MAPAGPLVRAQGLALLLGEPRLQVGPPAAGALGPSALAPDPLEQRRDAHQIVVLALQVGPGARPDPIPRPAHQSGPHREFWGHDTYLKNFIGKCANPSRLAFANSALSRNSRIKFWGHDT